MKEPRERKATKRINEIYYDLLMGSPALDSLALEILAIKHYLDELERQTLKIMKPFDLKAACAGAPVVTRKGHPVTQLVLFDVDSEYSLNGVVQREWHHWLKDGREADPQSDFDLFMGS